MGKQQDVFVASGRRWGPGVAVAIATSLMASLLILRASFSQSSISVTSSVPSYEAEADSTPLPACPFGMNDPAVSSDGTPLCVSKFPFPPWHSPSDLCPFQVPAYTHPFVTVRPRLYQLLAEVIPDASTVLLLPTAPRPIRAESDAEFPGWRQSANILYLLGPYHISGGVVAVSRSRSSNLKELFQIDVYLPQQTEREAVFMGFFPSAETLRRRHLISDAFPIADLPSNLAAANASRIITTVSVSELQASLYPLTTEDLLGRHGTVETSGAARAAFEQARFVKNAEEIVLLKYASKVAGWAHSKVEALISFSRTLSENEIRTEFVRLCGLCGGDSQAYGAIVGAGPHGAVLHYRTGEDVETGSRPVEKETLVLIDAAPEFYGYASDLTRTHPRFKIWNEKTAEVYSIVASVQQRFIDVHYKEGAMWADINIEFVKDFTLALYKAGFLIGESLEVLLENNMHSVFMPHGLGHPVGLEVHDPTPANVAMNAADVKTAKLVPVDGFLNAWLSDPVLKASMLANYSVFRGHVATVEPGVYFIPGLLEIVRKDVARAKYVNWTKLDEGNYVELGGVRIEDVVLIDLDGVKRVITRR
ncbi:peptidase M24, structural domain-containing protein [Zopfochytrium polystomum]|nr:peptidase M24, structural domain-containing protein [Zopfochytrium polystomum]